MAAAAAGTWRQAQMLYRAGRESAYAHQVRKLQRFEEERVQLEDQREQVQLEQERLREEEISSKASQRARQRAPESAP